MACDLYAHAAISYVGPVLHGLYFQ